ncbi:hypothetical protein [Actinomadura verrucosospora]|uniref:hypothetical protein n=1 Tax=Actinomadura verrucosospora TaxID=46165 RepID=UPI001563B667|nr:hypothetical protein [Actinomadura verrucosospora]
MHRWQLLQVTAAMGDDLAGLQRTLTALKVEVGEGGHWDVAQQMGPKGESTHQNMISALDRYCAAYAAAIKRITKAAHNYGRSEQKATDAAQGAGRPPNQRDPVAGPIAPRKGEAAGGQAFHQGTRPGTLGHGNPAQYDYATIAGYLEQAQPAGLTGMAESYAITQKALNEPEGSLGKHIQRLGVIGKGGAQ